MAISRKPRQSENDFSAPTAQIFEDVDGENNKQVEKDRVAELEDALKELRAQREEERSDALLSQPHTGWQSQVTETPVEVNPNTIQLPDPALDPDGYANAVQRRAELAVDNKRNRETRQRKFEEDIDTKVSDLWADFGVEYPDIADKRDRVDFVATKIVKKATAKGLDINRYMFGAGRTRFMQDVALEYTNIFGEPEPDEDDYEDNSRSYRSSARTTRRPRSSNRNRQEDDEGRSAGIFGGNESSGRGSRREVDQETGPSMIDDLQVIQKKSGFF